MAQSLFKSYAMMLRANNAKPNLVKGYAQLALMNNCRSRPLLEQSQPYCSSRSLEKSTVNISDEIQFSQTQTPVLLNAQTHAVGYLSRILNAQVYDIAVETPLQPAINMSKMLKNDIFFKREDQQPVFSFKIRGAYNKIASLTEDQLARGIVACSAGNHAQGVALSAARLGARAVIVMPLATPGIKVSSVRNFGGGTVEVRLHGANYDEAAAEAKRAKQMRGKVAHSSRSPKPQARSGGKASPPAPSSARLSSGPKPVPVKVAVSPTLPPAISPAIVVAPAPVSKVNSFKMPHV
uniref:Tryptophan synthase beta chain-like PALP domain-containing protein n=1 Tax=Heterosigma akashiwo TaxID=2829 RepID=A0A6V1P332_HETAK